MEPLRDTPLFIQLFSTLQNPVLGVLVGTLVTIAIQSSSASIGILQALSSTGAITWGSAIPIILGQNIGTCSTPLIASIGASTAAKRSAVVHLYFNVIGTTLFLGPVYGFKAAGLFPFTWNEAMNKGDIANFHTLFNVLVTLLFIPFARVLAKLAEMTIPILPGEAQEFPCPCWTNACSTSPAVAIQQAKSAVETMARNAQLNYAAAIPVLYSHDSETLNLIHQRENIIDQLEVAISNYLVKITDKELSENESHAVSELLNFIVEYERIGDYAINVRAVKEMFDKELSFTDKAKAELAVADKHCRRFRASPCAPLNKATRRWPNRWSRWRRPSI